MASGEHLFELDVFIRETQELLLPSSLLDREGGVLNSTADTLRPGSLYILGLNPGGGLGQGVREVSRDRTRSRFFSFSSRNAHPECLKNAPPVSRDHRSGG